LVTDQVPRKQPDLATGQVEKASSDLPTGQVEPKQPDLSTEQVRALSSLSEKQWEIVDFCDIPRKTSEIMDHLEMTSRWYFKEKYLDPLIQGGVISMTNIENPTASNQRYVLSDAGVKLKAARIAKIMTDPDEDKNGKV